MNLKYGVFSWIMHAKCPCCGIGTFEFIRPDFGSEILVNNESKGRVKIHNLWVPSKVCDNPNCEWSKIKEEVEANNLTSSKVAWEYYKKID